ncbi:MFS general substrate transporter [Alternaria alternata]|uniref:MFS general substrate transporter n=1 Tax=Alternaria alternata TaxID=5599 RepID=A0A177DBP8_ALTAL|nr:MFS general substrate transporter [Alternaria alternata]OAG17213.1 MFS general substrate transporter [Alternaria alternata]
MLTGASYNKAGLMTARAFLGFFEAAFGASAPYFLSLFYQRQELGKRVALLTGMSLLANSPTVLCAVLVYCCLPDSPDTAHFLTDEEKLQARQRLATVDRTEKLKVSWTQVFAGLTDYQNWVYATIHFCCNYLFAALSNFLPTIVRDIGYSSVNAQGLTAPAYFLAFLCCMFAAWGSDRFGKRGWFVAGFATIGTVGYLMLAAIQDKTKTGPHYAAIYLATCGIFPAGAGLGILATFRQCSSFVSSTLFPSRDGPFYVTGCAVRCAFSGLAVVLALSLH